MFDCFISRGCEANPAAFRPRLGTIAMLLFVIGALGCATRRGNQGLASGAIFEFGPCRAAGATCGPEGRRAAGGGDAAVWRGGPFRAGPYLVQLAPGRFSVNFVAESKKRPRVQWWLASEGAPGSPSDEAALKEVKARRSGGLWTASFGPQPQGQRIGYRIVLDGHTSKPYHFRSGPRPGKPFRFIVYGDTRTYHLVHWRVIQAMSRHDADFVIHTGDLVENGGVEEEWLTFFSIIRPMAAGAPFFPAFGNHDISSNGLFRRFFLFEQDESVSGPDAQPDQRYYVRDWGRLRIVVIDPEVEYRAGSPQYQYLERALAEAVKREMFIVMATHKPPYSSGSHGSYAPMREVIDDLGLRFGVELVVSGHDHNYERVKDRDGMTLVVTGGGGAPIHPVDPQDFSAAVRTEPHYVVVDVDETGLAMRAVNIAGETFDSHLITPNPPKTALTRLGPQGAGRY
jgi:3',5'-cyclic AMP phosphodiesterase CpdA